MNAKEFLSSRHLQSTLIRRLSNKATEEEWDTIRDVMEAYLAHRIEEAEKANPLNAYISWNPEDLYWDRGYSSALNKLKEG